MLFMRNFPTSWVAQECLAELPGKIRKILGRFGQLQGDPEVSASGQQVSAVATFADVTMARVAVQTLHGVDMRSEVEKQLAGHRPPQDSDRFWICIQDEAAAAVRSLESRDS